MDASHLMFCLPRRVPKVHSSLYKQFSSAKENKHQPYQEKNSLFWQQVYEYLFLFFNFAK
jgi:hypothetical protein